MLYSFSVISYSGLSRVESMAFFIPIMMLQTRLKFSWAGWISFAESKTYERYYLDLRILFFLSVFGTF